MAGTITWETKKEGQRKTKRHTAYKNTKKRERVSPSRGGKKPFHPRPSNVACMQIVRFNNNGRSKTSITNQYNLPLYNKG
jgi:hypothetical protein